jgi:hypothetical protein
LQIATILTGFKKKADGRRKKAEGKHNNDILSGLTSLPVKLYFLLPFDKAQGNTICLSTPTFSWLTLIGK